MDRFAASRHGLAVLQSSFKFPDLVSQQGRFFEFEIIRGPQHFLLELLNRFSDVDIYPGFLKESLRLFATVAVSREAFLNRAADTSGCDVVFLIVCDLLFSAIIRHCEKFLDALGHDIGVKNDFTVEMTRSAAGGLN